MLCFIGLSHQHAPLDVRERCAVAVEDRARARAALARRLPHAVMLSTCGRVEIYADASDPEQARAAALEWLAARAGVSPEALEGWIETAEAEDAVTRIVRVACGLESAVEGEDEILGQVRRAWLDAGIARMLSPQLDAAFRLAVRTGRQARRGSGAFGHGNEFDASLADTAAAHVALTVSPLAVPRVLIAGSGPMGMRAAHRLRERFGDTLELTMVGRTPERIERHAAEVGARPLLLAGLPAALAWADAAIVGLRTRGPIIGPEQIGTRPAERPLLIVDLSLPRAVAASAGEMAHVSLRNVDELSSNEGRRSRWDADGRRRAEHLVERAVEEHAALRDRSDAMTTLTSLRIQADGIRRSQLERTLRRLPELDPEARWAVDALTRAIVNRILHEPTLRLKADGDEQAAAHARALFGLEM